MSGTSGDEDDDAGTLYFLACPGYRYHFGGGKPPPPMVNPMQNAGSLACTEQEAPCHCPVCQGIRKEAQTAGIGGAAGEFIEGLPDLRVTVGDCDFV